jgi:hypothetical protein
MAFSDNSSSLIGDQVRHNGVKNLAGRVRLVDPDQINFYLPPSFLASHKIIAILEYDGPDNVSFGQCGESNSRKRRTNAIDWSICINCDKRHDGVCRQPCKYCLDHPQFEAHAGSHSLYGCRHLGKYRGYVTSRSRKRKARPERSEERIEEPTEEQSSNRRRRENPSDDDYPIVDDGKSSHSGR